MRHLSTVLTGRHLAGRAAQPRPGGRTDTPGDGSYHSAVSEWDTALRKRHLFAVSLGVLLMVTACSSTELTVHDITGHFFGNNDELIAWLDCDGQWYSTPDGIRETDIDWNQNRVVATATKNMGVGGHPPVSGAVRAGNVWVLIAEDGRLFGGLEPRNDLVWCTDE